MAGRPRQLPPEGPCEAQRDILTRFERAYFDKGDGSTLTTLEEEYTKERAQHPWFKGTPEAKEDFSRSTYHQWKRQESSPRLCDLEVLARVLGDRLTLVLDPLAPKTTGADVNEFDERLETLVEQLRELPVLSQGAALKALEVAIKEERATRSPRDADVSAGPARVRNR